MDDIDNIGELSLDKREYFFSIRDVIPMVKVRFLNVY